MYTQQRINATTNKFPLFFYAILLLFSFVYTHDIIYKTCTHLKERLGVSKMHCHFATAKTTNLPLLFKSSFSSSSSSSSVSGTHKLNRCVDCGFSSDFR
jgi:hypothetical protein